MAACNTTTVRQNLGAQTVNPAQGFYQQGQKYWQDWEASDNTEDLQQAHTMFKKAWQLGSQDLNFQHAYYLSSVYLGFYRQHIDAAWLEGLYQQLDPSVRAEVPPPVRLSYALGTLNQEAPATLLPLVKKAIKQRPDDALGWKNFSEQYARQGHYHLAAAAAHKAYSIDSESGDNAWQLGLSLTRLADELACENREELKRAAFYTAKGAAKQQDNAWWYASSAQRYIELGLLPLAWHQLQMALVIEPNAAWLTAYIHASIIEGDRFQDEDFVNQAMDIEHTAASFEALAMAAASLGEWQNATDFMEMAAEQAEPDIYDRIINNWLKQLADEGGARTFDLEVDQSANHNAHTIAQFILNKNGTRMLASELQPVNNCTQQKADFYNALKAWQTNERKNTLEYLRQAADSPVYFAREKVWSAAFLQGMQHEQEMANTNEF